MSTNHNRIKVSDLETNGPDKILITNEKGELEFEDINSIKTNSYNGLDYIQEGKSLDARQGKVLKELIYNSAYAPHLEELIPNHFLPNETNNIIVKGSFFTPSTTITIEGQIINYIKFKSDNEIIVNVTTGNAEGNFDITLNNGKSTTYIDALTIILGTIFTPLSTDWNSQTGAITATDGKVETLSYMSTGSVIWNSQLDWTKNFEIRCKPRKSSLGIPIGYQYSFLQLLNASDNSNKLNLAWNYPSNYVQCRAFFNNEAYSDVIGVGSNSSLESWNTYIENIEIKVRWLDGILTFWHNGQLKKTFSGGLTQNVKLKASVYSTDLYDIKYIELAT